MKGPGWLADLLAITMLMVAIMAAASSASWLRRRGRPDPSPDVVHLLASTAMAGMFEPRFAVVPANAWLALFIAGACWFAWQALYHQGGMGRCARFAHPIPYAIECTTMIYMIWSAASQRVAMQAAAGIAAMSAQAGVLAGNPALALVLAVLLLGCVMWRIDQVTHRLLHCSASPSAAASITTSRLHACQRILMSLAMGYMLVTMM